MFEGAAAKRPFFFAVRGARAVRVRRLKPPWDARLRPGTAEARCPSRGLAPALETGFHVGIGDDIDLRLRSWNPKCVLTIGRLLLEIPQRGRYNSALRALRRPPPQAQAVGRWRRVSIRGFKQRWGRRLAAFFCCEGRKIRPPHAALRRATSAWNSGISVAKAAATLGRARIRSR